MTGWIDAIAHRPAWHRLFFVLLLIAFGTAVSAISFLTAQYTQAGNIQKELVRGAEELARFKLSGLQTMLDNHKNRLIAAKESVIFRTFLQNPSPENLQEATELFMALTASSGDIYQFRFIGRNGHEVIRIERNRPGNTPFAVPADALQNKADRSYFAQTAALPPKSLWISPLELNVEHGRIEMPIVPTLRIATPVYRGNTFSGIVVINLFMRDILENLTYSPSYYISLLDRDGHTLIDRHNQPPRHWTRYLNAEGQPHPVMLKTPRPEGQRLMGESLHLHSATEVLPNADQAVLAFRPKLHAIEEMKRSLNLFLLTTLGVVMIFAIPLAMLLSAFPVRLSERLVQTQEALKKQWKVVDRFVLLTQTDTHGNITYATEAYCELTGFKSAELIGKTHAVVRHPDTPQHLYEQMWQALQKGESWHGELQNRRKDGSDYWLRMSIEPSDGGYACYMQNITYQKKVEELSITDEMTRLYNRRFFNRKAPEELSHARREGRTLAFLILDVDNFKKYNDTYGHEAGDRVLKAVGGTLKAACRRPGDLAFRLGGEEFALIFTCSDAAQAAAYADEVRGAIEALKIEHKANTASPYVTASFGLALSGEDIDAYYKAADGALYQAKESGRNRVCTA